VTVIDLDSAQCRDMLQRYIEASPDVWNEDIGQD